MAGNNAKGFDDPIGSPSGSDPALDNDWVAREKEYRKMAQGDREGDGSTDLDEVEDELDSLTAQAGDPEAQES